MIELFGDGKQRRDLNFVEDVVDALLLAGLSEAAEGEIFNLGTDEPTSVAEVAAELLHLTGRGSVQGVPFPPDRQLIEIGNCYSSYRKIENALGWRPQVKLREGLSRTLEFYQKHRANYWDNHASSIS